MDSQPRLLLVHGSVVNADLTWSAQKPLADRFEIVAPNRRGFPPGPDVERVDFEDEAVWLEQLLEPDTPVVGHYYGRARSLLAASLRPKVVPLIAISQPPAVGYEASPPSQHEVI